MFLFSLSKTAYWITLKALELKADSMKDDTQATVFSMKASPKIISHKLISLRGTGTKENHNMKQSKTNVFFLISHLVTLEAHLL